MTVQVGCIGNNTGTTRVGEFGCILWGSWVYPKFYIYGVLYKAFMDKLSIDSEARTCGCL